MSESFAALQAGGMLTLAVPTELGGMGATIREIFPVLWGQQAPVRHISGVAAVAIEAMVRNDVQAVFAIPVMLQRMVDQVPDLAEHARRLTKLRVIATSGSAYPSGFTTRFMDAVGDVLYNLYGSTEASWVAIATPQDLRRDPDTAGTPPLGTVVRIVDGDGNEVPEGEKGRIFCGNELVFDGYTSGADKDRMDGLVATGDLGYVKDGLYFVAGREDDMIVSGGENVYPSEVESLLAEHPAVLAAAAITAAATPLATAAPREACGSGSRGVCATTQPARPNVDCYQSMPADPSRPPSPPTTRPCCSTPRARRAPPRARSSRTATCSAAVPRSPRRSTSGRGRAWARPCRSSTSSASRR